MSTEPGGFAEAPGGTLVRFTDLDLHAEALHTEVNDPVVLIHSLGAQLAPLVTPDRLDRTQPARWFNATTATRRCMPDGAGQRYFRRACRGMSPNLPEWKSLNACMISVFVFITNGPPIATGWPIGWPL